MQHEIPIEQLGPHGSAMAEAVEKCVHCGFCLPSCPTYQVMEEEMDSPRGRIFLMKEVLEGRVELAEATPYIDHCLGCMACETSCPSGVPYGELLTPFRARAEGLRRRSWFDRVLRRFVLETLPYPGRFRLAAKFAGLGRLTRPLLPTRLGDMLDLLPAKLPPRQSLPEITPAVDPRRARAALLAGCAQQVLAPEINRATIDVLSRNGVEVVVPTTQVCCGALAAHTGALWQAKSFARKNLHAFPSDVDVVLTNAAGCGSGMHEYALWLAGEPEEERARQLAARVQDVSQFLGELGMTTPAALAKPTVVAYHDACHLAHAQGVRRQPRDLLSQVANLQLVELSSPEICCGSAGTYNIEQPDTARELGRRKAESILASGASIVATGNIGCLTQISTHLAQLGRPLPVRHTMQLLAEAMEAE